MRKKWLTVPSDSYFNWYAFGVPFGASTAYRNRRTCQRLAKSSVQINGGRCGVVHPEASFAIPACFKNPEFAVIRTQVAALSPVRSLSPDTKGAAFHPRCRAKP